MAGRGSRSVLRALFTALGAIAITTGLLTVVTGTGSIPGDNPVSASVDSELRFFAVFWIAYGVAALRVAPRADTETGAVRVLALTLFAAGIGRAAAWIATGQPHALFIGLLFVELIGPPLVVVWQARLSMAR